MREVVRAMSAVAAAYAAMGVVAMSGLLLLGADGVARLAVATVTMAGGGGIDVTGELPQAQRLGASLHGGLDVMPLGVSLAGVLVLVVALRRPAASPRALVVRLGTAAVAFPAVLTLSASAGHGRLALGRPCVHGPYGLSGCATDDRAPAGGLTLDYHPDLGRTLLGGLVWVLVVLALVALLQCRPDARALRLPAALSWMRPAVSVSATVILCAALAVEAAGLLVALVHGPKAAGAVVLVAPNAAFAAFGMGIGVPWSAARSTPGGPVAMTGIAHGQAWLPPIAFAVTTLAVIGVLTAARTPVPPGVAWRRVRAARLGLPLGVLSAGMTAAAGASAHLGVSVFGFAVTVLGLRCDGDILVALALGSAAGAVAGTTGCLLLDLGRQATTDRVRTAWNSRKTPTV
ncbi:streptophobe family protein [Actinoallomurus bryophytorum]|uniref:Uncharacterized protein n=1 Tax=Actinoallomurus bryophytorum TaxID=1490222 RepID=A0A543CPT0_9ACTN|nr:streptophobe family protein [Actinoallomurus bryophytorum]TQL99103.1 hypothetical protein FB559_4759 [Actinoallomurus bryophytorum]